MGLKNSKEKKQSNTNQSQPYLTINQSKINQSSINQLERYQTNTNQSKREYLKFISQIKAHKDWIKSVKIFPSGNIISVSDDRSIKIFDGLNYKLLQNIENAHNNSVINLFIKDENNFASYSDDRNINIWN